METQARSPRDLRPAWIIALFTLVGLGLRWFEMHQGIWRDEGSTYFDAFGGSVGDVLSRVTLCELNPPGYFLLMHLWMALLPVTDVLFKTPSLLCSALLVPACAELARTIAGVRAAIIAAAITAAAPMTLYYGQEARPYMLEALLAVVTATLFLRLMQGRGSTLEAIGLALAATAMLYVQYTGALFLAALVCGGLVTVRLRPAGAFPLAGIAAALVVPALLFLPWLPSLHTQMQAGLAWEPPVKPLHMPVVAAANLLVTIPLDWVPKHKLVKAIFVVVLLVVAVLLARKRFDRRIVAGLIASIVAVVVTAVLEIPVANHGRYMVGYSPIAWVIFAVVASMVLSSTMRLRRVAGIVITVCCAILFCYDIPVLATTAQERKSGAEALASVELPNDALILVAPDLIGPTVGYYLRDRGVTLHGLARWNDPQYFEPLDFKTHWTDSKLVDERLADVARAMATGNRSLVVITNVETGDASSTDPNARFVARLAARYHLRPSVRKLPGRIETIFVDRFAGR